MAKKCLSKKSPSVKAKHSKIKSGGGKKPKVGSPKVGECKGAKKSSMACHSKMTPKRPKSRSKSSKDARNVAQVIVDEVQHLFANLGVNLNESNKEATRILLKECEAKYGSVARQVCSLLVSVLEVLPFAVIIDESILCLHSGPPIVSAGNQVTMIADIPSPLANVEDNAVALEILSDTPTEVASGNGQEFTLKQFRTFMQLNSLSFLIRGNSISTSVNISHYTLHFEARCISLASHTAKPMIVLVDAGKRLYGKAKEVKDVSPILRVVQLDNSLPVVSKKE